MTELCKEALRLDNLGFCVVKHDAVVIVGKAEKAALYAMAQAELQTA